jgi:drug/metabolite transporter (DMT)-like permease
MKYTQASIASALNQTSTLWTFLLAALLLHEPVTWKRAAGLAIGLFGVALVTLG